MEKLEKAANEYADKHGFRVPYDGSDKFYDEIDVKASYEGFKEGANWWHEHIWHDASEEPESNSDKGIVMMLNNYQPYAGIFRGSKFLIDNKVHWEIYDGFCSNTIDLPTKWAYIEDILPIKDKE